MQEFWAGLGVVGLGMVVESHWIFQYRQVGICVSILLFLHNKTRAKETYRGVAQSVYKTKVELSGIDSNPLLRPLKFFT